MSYNAGLLYYRHYYDDIDFSKPSDNLGNKAAFEKQNGVLFKLSLHIPKIDCISVGSAGFKLTTTYPGLTLGTGYAHGSALLGELKIGFFFDHTTGLPVIPGSSVKGILRSVFPGAYLHAAQKHKDKNEEKQAVKLLKKATAVEKFIQKLLKEITAEEKNAEFVKALECEIFGNIDSTDNGIPMFARDVFYDAFPVKSENNSRNTKYGQMPADSFLADDFITPHINRKKPELSPFTDPTPIAFLKVLPGVTFQFQFDLKDSTSTENYTGITKEQKTQLFEKILQNMGAGAKTNVGYGQFAINTGQNSSRSLSNTDVSHKTDTPAEAQPFLKKAKMGELLQAKVIAVGQVEIRTANATIFAKMTGNCPEVGTLVSAKINGVDNKTDKITSVSYQGPAKFG